METAKLRSDSGNGSQLKELGFHSRRKNDSINGSVNLTRDSINGSANLMKDFSDLSNNDSLTRKMKKSVEFKECDDV